MLKKINSLEYLRKNNFNIHEYQVPESEDDLFRICCQYKKATIRFDSIIDTRDYLPFYIVETGIKEDGEYGTVDAWYLCKEIWKESVDKSCKLVVSNGINYDDIQLFNMVARLDISGDFHCEVSDRKIPLRLMYRHKLLSISGNVSDDIQEWQIYSHLWGIDRKRVQSILRFLYEKEIYDKFFELTYYPTKVGVLEKNIVFWQIL